MELAAIITGIQKKSDSPIWFGLWSTAIIPKPNKTACTIIKTITASAKRIFVSLVIATPFLSHEYLPQGLPRGRQQSWRRDSLSQAASNAGLGTHNLCLWLIPAAKKTTRRHWRRFASFLVF
jgi:hypothetical protein